MSEDGEQTPVDTNGDGEIQVSEAEAVFDLNIMAFSVVSLEGLDSFTGLHKFTISSSNSTYLDLTPLFQLENAHIYDSSFETILFPQSIEQINLSELPLLSFTATAALYPNLVDLSVADCVQLQSLEVNGSNLTHLTCYETSLTQLDVSGTPITDLRCEYNLGLETVHLNSAVTHLNLHYNALNALDLSAVTHLTSLNVNYNNLTELHIPDTADFHDSVCDVGYNLLTSLTLPNCLFGGFYCDYTSLVSIDMPKFNMDNFQGYSIYSNSELQFLSMRNGVNDVYLGESAEQGITFYLGMYVSQNPQLTSICLDDFEITDASRPSLEFLSNTEPYPVFTTYCTMRPSGDFHTISGNLTMNCGDQDIPMANVKLELSGDTPGFAFTDANGNYTAYCGNGNVTLTPVFENAAYFSSSPANFTQNFTGNGTEVTANFCISATQTVHDLEVTLIQTSVARPGFDAMYKVVVHNKGSQIESGNLAFSFDDALIDFVSATPSVSSLSTGILNWNFNNLAPFSSAVFNFRLNVNSPVETPAVNIGDVLSFTAIATISSDATPNDNTATLAQTVVGSYDPNDKTVHEGETISPDQVGDYLHYTIRFQNTGNYPAQNVVVKDMLASNLDKSTLQVIASSHPYRATLTQNNKLEFFFENIQLPGEETDEPNSHGFVSFKIKPMANVAVNDAIQNTASIFFDYNAPIMTNTVATMVTMLGAQEIEMARFDLWPNPASDEINIKSNHVIDKIEIRNTLGQEVLAESASENQVKMNVSGLASGVYYVSVTCGKAKSVRKLIL